MPKSFDPALAVAPPETDVVRAIYEGLTDTDAKTLKAAPAIAVDWSPSIDFKTWTFKLRPNAHWSNNERVTANDFARSWKRLARMGKNIPSYKLLQNIVGMQAAENTAVVSEEADKVLSNPNVAPVSPFLNNKQPDANAAPQVEPNSVETNKKSSSETKNEKKNEPKLGVEAIDDFTLKVSLINADKDFPSLVAHPVFRPVYGDGKQFEDGRLNADIVTNGAFRIVSVGDDGVTLDRSEHFWNKETVDLERVRFVPTESAEKALEAYRNGEVDAVTNAEFEPLALKLLTPFDDFRRTTHGALNFYEFNRNKKPFDNLRVREALAIAIERERLTEGDTEGATKPALDFLPFDENEKKLAQDVEKAKNLLSEAGFPNGENFPVVRLVVNRNDVQQRVARSVARMWKQNLNIETEIVVKESSEVEAAKTSGDFDMIRRGEVLPTSNETANMLTIFPPQKQISENSPEAKAPGKNNAQGAKEQKSAKTIEAEKNVVSENAKTQSLTAEKPSAEEKPASETIAPDESALILTEEEAIAELPAIPLYFPTSYSLVKPYIHGFEINILDAPSLKDVKIDFNWQPEKPNGES